MALSALKSSHGIASIMSGSACLRSPYRLRAVACTSQISAFRSSTLRSISSSRPLADVKNSSQSSSAGSAGARNPKDNPKGNPPRSINRSNKPDKKLPSIRPHGSLTAVPASDTAAMGPYQPPTTGLLSYLPPSWVPYAELIRIDKPVGTYYLFLPCAFSTLLAATMTTPMAHPMAVLSTSLLFLTGAFIMRGAGCTINDLLDRNLDSHVSRTRLRPIARGAITPRQAVVFTGAQLLGGLAVLVQFPTQCLFWGIPSLAFVSLYPLAKRVTYYPQVVFGLTFSWGAVMGFPALGIDLLSNIDAASAAICLYTSCFCWGILYDLIYAHQDVQEDAKAGIKSMALKYNQQTKMFLTSLALAQVSFLGAAGIFAGSGLLYMFVGCGSAITSLGIMIYRVNLASAASCWWWFRYGCLLTGGGITLGLASDYLARYTGVYPSSARPFSSSSSSPSPSPSSSDSDAQRQELVLGDERSA